MLLKPKVTDIYVFKNTKKEILTWVSIDPVYDLIFKILLIRGVF